MRQRNVNVLLALLASVALSTCSAASSSTNGTSSASPSAAATSSSSASPSTTSVSSDQCNGNPCIGDWEKEAAEGGTVVQCADGTWSHAGGLSGACSDHGGEESSANSSGGVSVAPAATTATTTTTPTTGDPAQVVTQYWSYMSDDDTADAWNLFSPAEQERLQGYAGWSSSNNITNVSDSFSDGAQSGTTATVDVNTLVVTAGGTTTSWSGSYAMVYENGQWMIDRANLTS